MKLFGWARRIIRPEPQPQAAPPPPPPRLSVNPSALVRARTRKQPPPVFGFAKHPPSVTAGRTMAQDSALNSVSVWANNSVADILSSQVLEGQTFLGYAYLSELAQRPEYRVMSETIASEMTRKWITFQAKDQDDEDKQERIAELEEEFKRLRVREVFEKAAEQDGFFGRAHIYIDTDDGDDPDELQQSLGDGWDQRSRTKVKKNSLRSLKNVEAVWCYPTSYNSNNPLADSWYRPDTWFVQAQIIHRTRLLTFIGREVPDLLKPTYSFGGLSLSQMAKPYVDNWLQTRQGVNEIITSFTNWVLKTDLMTQLQSDGAELFKRMELFNAVKNNQGLMVTDKEGEEFEAVSAPLAGLDVLQAQAQEHMASVSHIPLVKLLGTQPAGLNASSEGEIRVFYDFVHSFQEKFFRDNLRTIMGFAMLNLWGEVDTDIDFVFEPLWALDGKELAEVRKTDAETDATYIDSGVLDPAEVRQRIASDPDSGYNSIDAEDVPDLLSEEMDGLEPEGGRPQPQAEEVAEAAEDADTGSLAALLMALDAFNPDDHPHAPAGSSKGGQFVKKGSGGGSEGGESGPVSMSKAATKVHGILKQHGLTGGAAQGKSRTYSKGDISVSVNMTTGMWKVSVGGKELATAYKGAKLEHLQEIASTGKTKWTPESTPPKPKKDKVKAAPSGEEVLSALKAAGFTGGENGFKGNNSVGAGLDLDGPGGTEAVVWPAGSWAIYNGDEVMGTSDKGDDLSTVLSSLPETTPENYGNKKATAALKQLTAAGFKDTGFDHSDLKDLSGPNGATALVYAKGKWEVMNSDGDLIGASMFEDDLASVIAEATGQGSPAAQPQAESTSKLLGYLDHLGFTNVSGSLWSDGKSQLALGSDGQWVLSTPGHMSKTGQGRDALQALLQGKPSEWAAAGVKNSTQSAEVAAKGMKDGKIQEPTATAASLKDEMEKQAKELRDKLAAHRPKFASPSQHKALLAYKGSGYMPMNQALRKGEETHETKELRDWLSTASLAEDVTLYRGISGSYATQLASMVVEGTVFRDRGFISTTVNEGFAKSWASHNGSSASLLMTIRAKKGQRAATARGADEGDSEYEVVVQADSRLRVVSFDFAARTMECELIQD